MRNNSNQLFSVLLIALVTSIGSAFGQLSGFVSDPVPDWYLPGGGTAGMVLDITDTRTSGPTEAYTIELQWLGPFSGASLDNLVPSTGTISGAGTSLAVWNFSLAPGGTANIAFDGTIADDLNAKLSVLEMSGASLDVNNRYLVSEDIVANPDVTGDFLCDNSSEILLIIDESGSIAAAGATDSVRTAVNDFINDLSMLSGETAQLSLITFSSLAAVDFGYTTLNPANTAAFTNFMNTSYNPGGSTNYNTAFALANTLSPPPEIVVFFTDGQPNAYPFTYVTQANILKSNGAHIYGIGVADAELEPLFSVTDADASFSIEGSNALVGDFDIGSFSSLDTLFGLILEAAPVVAVGSDLTMSSDTSFTIGSTGPLPTFEGATLTWTTTGSGYFVDPTILGATYVPSLADYASGSVDLILSVTASGICSDSTASDTLTLTISAPAPLEAIDDAATTPEDTPVNISILDNDPITGGTWDLSSVTIISGPSNGTVVVNPDGTVTYTPDPGFNGVDMFDYQVCVDGLPSLCDVATVTVTVTDVNDPPVAVDDVASTDEDTPVTIDVLSNDIDLDGTLDPGSVTITSGPSNGTVTVNPDGTITYTPNPGFNGTDSFTYEVCDDDGDCDTATVSINVNDINDPPVANDDTDNTLEDTPVTTDVLANDLDLDGTLDPSSVSVISGPSNGTVVVNPDGSITYTPNPGFNGTDSYTYEVCDDDGDCATATVTITVADVNDPPVAVDDVTTTDEDTPVTIDVLGNDSDSDGTLDPGSVTITSGPSNGTVVVNPDGTITYTPDPDFNGTDTFTYEVCDDDGDCDTATVTVNVNDVNDPPMANDDVDNTLEDTPVTTDVLGNDIDLDGTLDPTSVNVISGPSNGTTTVNPDGTITYTPNPGFNGTDSYTYEVCDDDGDCDTATVTINVGDVNDPPIAVDDVATTDEDTPVTIDVLGNDSDSDGTLDPGSVTITSGPSNGTVVVNPDGTITYTPDPDFNGTDTFTYEVCDDDGDCDTATVTINVNDVNDPPVANDDVDNTIEDTPVTTDVLANDVDLDGTLDPTSVNVISGPSNGTTTVNPDGTITYTPNPGFNGTDSYTYEVCDDDGDCATATVTINVGDVNDPPIAVDDVATTDEDTPVTIDVLANDSDTDGTLDPGSVNVTSGPSNGSVTVNPDGTITYTPDPDFNGVDVFTYEVCDDDGDCDTATVTITVNDINDPPIANDDVDNTIEDTPVTTDVLANDLDIDGTLDPTSVAVTSGPSNGTTTVNPDGTITYTPNPGFNGTDTYTYVVCDDDGDCDMATVTINVGDVNDPPIAVDDVATTDEDTPVTIDVLANDSDSDGTLDPGSVNVTSGPSNGSVTVNPDGTITYTPDPDFNGVDVFTYEVCDDDGDCDTATVTITVNDVNDPPIANDDVDNTVEDTPVTTDVLANDLDIDGTLDPSSVNVISGPSNGTTTVNPDGTITYTPNPGFNGTDTYTYEVCDDDGDCDTATVTINVGDVNDPPIAVDDVATTDEDTPVTIDVLANDSDTDGTLDPTSVNVISGPSNGSVTVNPDGTITYTPDPDFNGVDVFTYEVCDDDGDCDTATVTITVNDINDPPIAVDDTDNTLEDTPVTTDVLANDSDVDGTLDPSSVNVISGPSNGSTTVNPDGTITYTPDPGFNGTDMYTYVVCDDDGDCDTAVVTITVGDVNDPPIAVDDFETTDEDTPVTVDVLANDNDTDGTLDPTSVTIISTPSNGTATVNPDGTITYTPNPDFNGVDVFTYEVCDDDGDCDQAIVTITVNDINDPPIAVDDNDVTIEDIPVTTDVLANDSDVDGTLDPSSVTVISGPSNGSTTVNPDGTITYTPDPGFNGTDMYTYVVCDDDGDCDTAVVTIVVGGVDEPPVAIDDSTTMPEDGGSVVICPGDNDLDPDGDLDVSTVTIIAGPSNGTITVDPVTGCVTYTPDPDFNGVDCMTYTICDSTGLCDFATICIDVTPVADPPVAVDDSITTPEDTPVVICVPDNDIDVDGDLDLSSVTLGTPPANGTITIDPVTGCITYTPDPDFVGTDCFTYVICDATGLCDSATTCITVTPVNDAPVPAADDTTLFEDDFVVIDILANDTDIDGTIDPTSVTITSGPSNGTATVDPVTGEVTYTPNPNYNGPDAFTYEVCDDSTPPECATATVSITVLPVNDPPVANDDFATTDEDLPIVIIPLANDDDPLDPLGNIDPTTVVVIVPPMNGSVSISPSTGDAVYTPDPDFNGTDMFTYVVCDDGNPLPPLCDTAVVFITINGVNDPLIAVNDTTTTLINTGVSISVLDNDIDPDGSIDPASVVILTPPTNGSVSIDPLTGVVTFTPEDGWCGTDSFEYQVCDDGGLCDDAWVFIEVECITVDAVDDDVTTPSGTAVDIDILINDSPNADWSCFVILTPPMNGTVDILPGGIVTYTPIPGFVGVDCFLYEICDDLGVVTDTATVCITVEEVTIIIPEVFTPNSDNVNDVFTIVGIEQYPNNQLLVFNRWENLIYEVDGYRNDWDASWDKNGEPVPDGTYYYCLFLDKDDPNAPVYRGFTTVYR